MALPRQWRKRGNGIGHGQNNTASSNQEKREAGTPTLGLIYDMTYLFFPRLLLSLSVRTSSGNNARRTIPAWMRQASPFFHGSQVI